MTSTFSTARYFRRLFTSNKTIHNAPRHRGMTSQSHLNRAVVESLENRLLMTALPATHLVFSTGPTDTVAGNAISSIVVSVEDSSNSVVLGDTSSVTLAVNSGPGSTTGMLFFAVQASNGVATISGLSLTQAGSYTLSATDGALTAAISSSFAITPDAASQLVFTTQPANGTAGLTLPSTTVSVEDQYGNVVDTDTSTITLGVSGNATLGGTVSASASNGVASFANLSMTQSGSYHLSATDGALAAGSSATFSVAPAAATQLAFTTQPVSTTAGATLSTVTVAVQDQYGNVVTTGTSNVTISVGSGNGSLGGTLTASTVNGVATFSSLSLTTVDAYTLSASTTGGLTGATSSSFNITAAAASKVVFSQQPASASAGALATVTVSVQDQYGNVVTSNNSNVTVSLATGNGTLLGTTTVAASSGVATFSTLAMHTPGTFTLQATDGALTLGTSSSFVISPAAASQLVFTTQPVNMAAGVVPTVAVAVEDQYGNIVTSDTSNVTLAFASGAGSLGGTTTVAAVGGVATFANLSIHTPNSFMLGATDGALSNATSSSFTVTPAAATHLVFTQQPGNITAGALGTVTVSVEDQYNNVVTSDTSNITLTMASGGGTLLGTQTVAAVNGVATFSGISVHTAGTFTLGANDGALSNAVSGSFIVSPAAASQLVFTSVPSSTVAGSGTFATTVAIEDQYGNTVTSSSANVGLAVTTGGQTFNLVVAASSGVATFSGITLVHAGPGSMRATSSGLPAVNNTSFSVTPAAASQLVITAQPAGTTAGTNLGTFTVAVEDQYNNIVTSDTSMVTLSDSGPGPMTGTSAVAAVNGVATFSNVSLRTVGSYTLTAGDGALTGATSNSFSITPAAASQLVFTQNTAGGVAGSTLSSVKVSVEDQYGNVVTTDSSNVTVSKASGTGTLLGTLTVAAVNGVATFSALSLHKTGAYTLAAADGALTSATSSNLTITPDTATHLEYLVLPSSTSAGALGTVTVAVEDQFHNVVTTNSSNISLVVGSGPGSLAGTTTVSAVNGVATFSDLALHTAGGYTISASGSVSGVNSGSFTITPAAASKLAILVQPSGAVAGQSMGNVTVAVEDQYGNVVTSDTSNVTLAMASGNATISGTTTVAAVNGVASFSGLSMTAAGSHQFGLTDGALSSATSNSFNITAAAVDHVAFATGPVNTVAGQTLAPVVVDVEDQYGNVVTTDSGNEVDILIASGNGTLAGTLAVNDVNGVATFSTLSITTADSYTLNASGNPGSFMAPVGDADSASFNITPDVANHLAVTTQATTTTAGQTISTVTVAVEDQYGNVVTTDSSNVTLASHTGNGTISGNTTVAAVNGVASFSTLSTTTADSYTLKFNDGSLANVTSSSFAVNAAAASKLAFTSPPTDTVAGQAIATFTVSVEDQYGNVVTTDSSNVTLNAMFATLNGNSTVAAVNGVATFSNVSITQSGGTHLSASDGNLNGASSSPFQIDHDVATKLVDVYGFGGDQGADGLGAMFIVAEDQYGNQIVNYSSNVTLSISSGNGTLLGTTTANSNGSAAFVGMMIHKAGTYTLTASNGVLTDWVSTSFNVLPSGASKVVFTTQPLDTAAGALGTVIATVEDQYGNTVTGDTSNVTVALNSNGTLGGTKTVAAVNGVATFSNLSLHTVGTYSLNASDGLLTVDNSNFFDITPAAADHLVYSAAPAGTTAGALGTVTVSVVDTYGNVVTSDSSNVTLSIGSGPGTLGGTVTVSASNGTATFSTLSMHTAGDYTITAADGSLTGITSDSFTITPAAADHVAFVSQPSTTIAGALGNVTAAVEDQYGNVVTTDSSNITVSIASGNGTLLGTLTVAADNGVATFSTLGLHKTGNYTLGAADGSLANGTSSSFSITPAASTQLLFTTQPSGGTAGNTLASLAVTIEDQYGNTATGDNSVVTLLCNAGVNSFTLNTAAVNGVATFSGFSVTKAGTFTFGATDGSLTPATSNTFTIAPQAATHLAFTVTPANMATGAVGTVSVAVEDQYNNIVTSDTSTITLALASGNGTLGGTLAVQATSGVATFSDLSLHTPGSFSINATDGSLTAATTSSFAVTPGAATQLVIGQTLSDTTAGTLPVITITLMDQYGNVCTNDSSSVTAAIGSGPGTLGGTTTVNVVNGVATFSNLAITTAGAYTLSFSDGLLSSGVSNSFTIAPSAASKLFILSGPSNITAGGVSTLTVAVEDAYGNLISNDNSAVTVSIASGSGSLGGTTVVNASNGVATFSDLSLHTAGAYTLGFSDGSLTGATSSSFTVAPDAPTHLAYATAPTGTSAGALNTVRVYVLDQYNNVVTTDSSSVHLALASGPGSLGGIVTDNAINGVVTFNSLSIHTAGTYTITATDGSLTSITSNSFNITPAAGTHLAVINAPSNTQAGALGSISFALEDQYNNIVTSSSANLTVTLASGNGTLGGTTTVAEASGTATFNNLTIIKSGTYSLAASSGGFTVSTGSFSISAAAASQLVFITPPANTANFNLNTITVGVEDTYGNIVTNSSQQVALTMGSGNVTLGGTTNVAAVNGIATFSDLTIAKSGAYTLNASAVGVSLSNATSSSFNVAAKLTITQQPTTSAAGVLSPITVQIQDTLGNPLSSDNSNVTLAFTSGPSATIGGTLTVQAVNGVATFSDLSLHTPGTYTFTVSDGVIAPATTANITVTPAAATHLVITSGPTNISAGALPTMTAAVEDQYGNVVTSNNSNVTITLARTDGGIVPANVLLNGFATVQAVNGIATFTSLPLTGAGSYIMTFGSAGLTPATSNGFTVSAAAASKVVVLTQTGNLTAGQSGVFTVALEDQYGNIVSTSPTTITASIGTGNGTLGGTLTANTTNGIATFSNLTLTKSGSYTLSFSGTSLTAGATSAFTIAPTASTHLLITHEPSTTTAGGSNLMTVAVEDQYGNVVTTDSSAVTMALASGSGTLGGTVTVNAVNGVASFSQFTLTKTGSYSVTVSDGSLNSATSTNFAITPAAASQLIFSQQPSNTSTSAIGTVSVLVEDQYGNLATNDSSNVTLAVGSGAGSLTGTTTAAVQNGVATFNNLTLTSSGFFTLTASDASLPTATSNGFSVAAKLAITNQPSTSAAGVLPAITVALEDSAGNILTADNSAVTLTIASGPAGSQILGTVTVNAVNGVATFSNAQLPTAGTYTLTASQVSGTSTNSTPITITPATAAAVAFVTTPASATAGVKMGSFAVQVRDQFGNLVTAATKTQMTLSVASGAGSSMSLKAKVVNGVATFPGGILKAAGNYTFTANFGGITGISGVVNVAAAAPKSVTFTQQPANTAAGSPFSVAVRVVDAFGNAVTSATPVTIAMAKKGTLAGTLTAITTNGIALFANLSIPTHGTFNLKATAAGKSATSSKFTVA